MKKGERSFQILGPITKKVTRTNPETGQDYSVVVGYGYNTENDDTDYQSGDEVHLDLIDEMSPGVIKINEPFLYVLMPMRVTG